MWSDAYRGSLYYRNTTPSCCNKGQQSVSPCESVCFTSYTHFLLIKFSPRCCFLYSESFTAPGVSRLPDLSSLISWGAYLLVRSRSQVVSPCFVLTTGCHLIFVRPSFFIQSLQMFTLYKTPFFNFIHNFKPPSKEYFPTLSLISSFLVLELISKLCYLNSI